MIVRNLDHVIGTDRDVEGPSFRSRRLLLAGDGADFSFHDTVLHAGTETSMWYRHHVEAVYCVEGTGRLENLETGDVHAVGPGTFYCLDGHERHRLRAETALRMMCVFTPPLTGNEVHDEDGTYPLLRESPGLGTEPDTDRTSRPSEANA